MFYIDKNICFRIISILSKPPPSWFVDSNMDNGNQSSFINEPVPPHSPSSFGFSAITVSVTSSPNTAFRSFQEEICTWLGLWRQKEQTPLLLHWPLPLHSSHHVHSGFTFGKNLNFAFYNWMFCLLECF